MIPKNNINSILRKEIVVYSQNIILHSDENEWDKTIHNNIAECHKNNVEQKKPDTKEYLLCDSLCIKNKTSKTSFCY